MKKIGKISFLSYLAITNSTRSQQAWYNIALHIERKVHVMLKWPPPLTKKATTTNRMKSKSENFEYKMPLKNS